MDSALLSSSDGADFGAGDGIRTHDPNLGKVVLGWERAVSSRRMMLNTEERRSERIN
jgi:hypothetical protein